MMAKSEKKLRVKIEQGEAVRHRTLTGNGSITIGRDPRCDVTVYGEDFPVKHVLFSGKNSHFQVNLTEAMQGEVIADRSRLTFKDMLVHNLLPRRGDKFAYPITNGKKGVVELGDTRISFQCSTEAASPRARFIGFSWSYATLRDLGKDLPFKATLIFMIILHTLLMKYISGFPIDMIPRASVNVVPERLARIIVRKPEPAADIAGRNRAAGGRDEAEASEEEPGQAASTKRDVKPEAQGVLGLLTGTGVAGQSSNLADFLLDKGLARELDEVIATTELTVGRPSNGSTGTDALDDLFAATGFGTGIDEIVETDSDVESFSFGRKGQIQVDQVGGMSGSEAALGQRSEESVRSVLRSYQGRLTYIYNKYLKRNPDLQGKMVVEVVIAAEGAVASVKLISSNMGQPDFEREILSFVRKWKYERIDQGEVTVTYPLFFSKVG